MAQGDKKRAELFKRESALGERVLGGEGQKRTEFGQANELRRIVAAGQAVGQPRELAGRQTIRTVALVVMMGGKMLAFHFMSRRTKFMPERVAFKLSSNRTAHKLKTQTEEDKKKQRPKKCNIPKKKQKNATFL